jgi:hypothetical protein
VAKWRLLCAVLRAVRLGVGKRLEENTRETRAPLSEIVGGGIKLMATDDWRELIVRYGLGRTTLPLAQVSRAFIAVQSNPRNDFI